MSDGRAKKACVKVGPLALVWLDLWTNRRGLCLEYVPQRGRGRCLFSVGFGDRFAAGRWPKCG